MKHLRFCLILAIVPIMMAACNNKKNAQDTDTSLTDSMVTETAGRDTSKVAEADSTHSYRNDRGTDSVSVGKSLPIKP